MSKELIKLRNSISSDFARRPRSLSIGYIKHWKAIEHQQLYTGFILKGLLRKDTYVNFLHVAIRILTHPALADQISILEYAENLLQHFVKSFQVIYGSKYVSYNIHNLLHL